MANLNLQATVELIDRMTAPLQSMSSQADRLTRAFQQTNGEMRTLQNQQRLISAFHSQSAALRETQQEFSQAHARLTVLRQEMAATANPSQTLIRRFEQAEERVERLNNRLQSQNQTLNQTRERLHDLGMNTANLSHDEQRLADSINRTNAQLEERRRRMERVQQIQERYHQQQQKLQNIRNTATAVAVGGAAALALPIKEYAQAEDAAMGLKVSMMDATGKVAPEFEKINALAERLGTSLPGSTADFSSMMAKLVQQGISFKDILGGVGEASANLAVVMKMPFADAAEFAAKMQDATKTSAADMTALMDVIQKSYYLGVDSTNMLSGFSKISAGMKTIKMEGLAGAKAIAPLLVMADQAAMAGESAGNAYSKIFAKMMDTKNIAKSLKGTGMGMDFTNGKGEFGGLDNMFKQLEKLKGLSTAARLPILSQMFGNDAETIQALNLLIDKGKAGYDETIAKMEQQASLQLRVNAQLSTLANLWDSAKGTFSSVMVLFGEALAPDIKALVEWITNMTEKIGDWAKANPELATNIMRVVAVVTILAVALAALSAVALTIIGPIALLRTAMVTLSSMGSAGQMFSGLVTGFNTVRTAITAITTGIGLSGIIMPLMALAVVALVIIQYWQPIKAFFTGLWQGISAGLTPAVEALKAAFAPLAPILSSLGSAFINLLTPMNFSASTLNTVQAAGYAVGAVIGSLVSTFISAGSAMGTFAGMVVVYGGQAVSYVASLPSRIMAFLSGLPAQMAAMGSQIMTGLKNGIMNSANAVLDGIKSVASRIKSAFTGLMGIRSPSRIFMSYGGHLMTGLANGINNNANLPLSATTALAGQISDQAPLGFDTRATVLPSRGMGGRGMAMGYAGGGGITININGATDPQAVAREVERVLSQRERNLQARNRSRLADID